MTTKQRETAKKFTKKRKNKHELFRKIKFCVIRYEYNNTILKRVDSLEIIVKTFFFHLNSLQRCLAMDRPSGKTTHAFHKPLRVRRVQIIRTKFVHNTIITIIVVRTITIRTMHTSTSHTSHLYI